MVLSKERMGEISYLLLKERIKETGLRLAPNVIRREIWNLSTATKVPAEELKEFFDLTIKELCREAFAFNLMSRA